ncbi:stress response protein NST1-like isoform X2 [Homarus americanus]|uniref:stress response protein NST1-like isoform X2 n=1 Tax=Homarus americanus TaxID=6706 RepID=UPI001C43BD67|nr:stress response protein NST1-like isoform X2 [Homarus americanus]
MTTYAANKPVSGVEDKNGTVTLMSQAEYNDKLETHQALVQAKSGELTQLMETLKNVRECKQPLTQVKDTLQQEINIANGAINTISEEATHLKQKLRYHSVKQIHGNIERLEYQLRNNNYKPREEQKILDEISMLQRSVKTLREYEAKQAENKKYRAERARLIEERNNNYSKIRALYAQEDDIKKSIATVRGDISSNKKAIDQLRQMKPKLEQGWMAHHHKLQAARAKRYEEKKRLRQEHTRERQEERRKLWEEYEASKEPYEEERKLCQVLISYLQSSLGGSTPCTPASSASLLLSPSTPGLTPATTPSTPRSSATYLFSPNTPTRTADVSSPSKNQSLNNTSSLNKPSTSSESNSSPSNMIPPDTSGSFYSKPKDDDDGFIKVSKRHKAKTKREQRMASRVKELPHTPDVLLKFSKLSIPPPKNTDQVAATIVSIQDCLQRFHTLSLSETNQVHEEEPSEDAGKLGETKYLRPTSLCVKGSLNLMGTTDYKALATPVASSSTAGLEHSFPGTSSPGVHQQTISTTIPVISVASPGTSWAPVISPDQFSTSDIPSNLNQITKSTQNNQPMYNGVHPSISRIAEQSHIAQHELNTIPDIPPEMKMCKDIVSQGNNESFFSMPVSYPSNLVELNNNAGCSYAAVAAKVNCNAFGLN